MPTGPISTGYRAFPASRARELVDRHCGPALLGLADRHIHDVLGELIGIARSLGFVHMSYMARAGVTDPDS